MECVRNVTKHPVWNNENQWYLIFPGCFACYLHGQWQSFVIELFIPLRHVKRARNSRVGQFLNVNTSLKNELVMYLWTIEKCNLIKCYTRVTFSTESHIDVGFLGWAHILRPIALQTCKTLSVLISKFELALFDKAIKYQ